MTGDQFYLRTIKMRGLLLILKELRFMVVGSPAGSPPFARYRAPQSAHQLPAPFYNRPCFGPQPRRPENYLPRCRRAGIFSGCAQSPGRCNNLSIDH
jgi:hypothetical protein